MKKKVMEGNVGAIKALTAYLFMQQDFLQTF